MPSDMQHERMRWGYMTSQKLLTRLRRITKPEKLQNFITLANENRNYELLGAARDRAQTLGLNYLIPLAERQAAPVARWYEAVQETADRGQLDMDASVDAKVKMAAKALKNRKPKAKPKVRMIRIGKGAK